MLSFGKNVESFKKGFWNLNKEVARGARFRREKKMSNQTAIWPGKVYGLASLQSFEIPKSLEVYFRIRVKDKGKIIFFECSRFFLS